MATQKKSVGTASPKSVKKVTKSNPTTKLNAGQNAKEISNNSSTSKNNAKTIKLEDVSDISKVSDLQKQWMELLDGPAIIIDASAVERIDTASLQLICSLYKAAKSQKIGINIQESSEAMDNAVTLLGLKDILKIH